MNKNKSDLSGIHLWLVLWKAAHCVKERALVSVGALGMCISDFAALEMLLSKGPSPVNEIGKKALLTSGSMTTAIDRLVKRGLVKRRNDPDDRRVRLVGLTARGRKLIRGAFSNHELDMEKAVSVLSGPERATLIKLLKKLGKGVRRIN